MSGVDFMMVCVVVIISIQKNNDVPEGTFCNEMGSYVDNISRSSVFSLLKTVKKSRDYQKTQGSSKTIKFRLSKHKPRSKIPYRRAFYKVVFLSLFIL